MDNNTMPPSKAVIDKKTNAAQKAFWQAITVGDLGTVKCLLEHKNIQINAYDNDGEQRQGCTALHLAILEMPTWKGSEGRNGIQTAEFVEKFVTLLLENGADYEVVCRYRGDWYLQTAAGKTKSFYPDGYDSIGLVLQFIEITRGADVIANDVTRRLELIRDMLLKYVKASAVPRPMPIKYHDTLAHACFNKLKQGKFTDVELKCGDTLFHAHKFILAARSEVFDAMFTVPCAEKLNRTVEIKEVDPRAFKAFLDFLYTDRIEEADMELTPDLLVLANRYDVTGLKQRCTFALTNNLTVKNASQVLSISDSSEAHDLKQRVLHFISKHVDEVMDTPEFEQLDAYLVREVLQSVVASPRRKRGQHMDLHDNELTASAIRPKRQKIYSASSSDK